MKYHGHELKKNIDYYGHGGSYYEIYKNDKHIISVWSLDIAKEFVDSFNGKDYHWNILY